MLHKNFIAYYYYSPVVAACLAGGVVGLSPLWMEQGKIVVIESGFKCFFVGNPIASQ